MRADRSNDHCGGREEGKEPFDREGWLFEPKWDGFRAVGDQEEISIDCRGVG